MYITRKQRWVGGSHRSWFICSGKAMAVKNSFSFESNLFWIQDRYPPYNLTYTNYVKHMHLWGDSLQGKTCAAQAQH